MLKDLLRTQNKNIEVHSYDGSLADNKYDVVVLVFALSTLHDQKHMRKTIKYFANYMKRKGSIVVLEFNPRHVYDALLSDIFQKIKHVSSPQRQYINWVEMDLLFNSCGMKLNRYESVEY